MNNLKNSVRLIGNLGADVELKSLESGQKLAKFSLATNEVYKNAEGEKSAETHWHQVRAWGPIAETMNDLLTKGDTVAILGKIKYNQYEDQHGEKRYGTTIQASEFIKLNHKQEIAL